jgi:uncharacterized membrane protein YphA (DoxX/SURF4 family)
MSNLIPRAAVASVWIYQGLWCKLVGRMPHHLKIVGTVPFFNKSRAHRALVALGLLECVIALSVLFGIWAPEAALLQTFLLAAMNAAGLVWASRAIPDPVGMLLQNFAFLVLAWIVAGSRI